MSAHVGVPAAIVDFVENIRLELSNSHPADLAQTIESLSLRLESQVACNAACADALLTYVETHLGRTRSGVTKTRQHHHALAVVTLYWSKDIVEYYRFMDVGRPTATALQQVAATYAEWPHAVHRINAARLYRHVQHIIGAKKNSVRIGDHAGPAAQHQNSYRSQLIKKADLELVLSWAKEDKIQIESREIPDTNQEISPEVQEYILRWTTLEELPSSLQHAAEPSICSHDQCHRLKLDDHGLLVSSKVGRSGPKRSASERRLHPRKKHYANQAQDDDLSPPAVTTAHSEPSSDTGETAADALIRPSDTTHNARQPYRAPHTRSSSPSTRSSPVYSELESVDHRGAVLSRQSQGTCRDASAALPDQDECVQRDTRLDAQYVEDSEVDQSVASRASSLALSLLSRRQTQGSRNTVGARPKFSGKRPGLRPMIPCASAPASTSNLFVSRGQSPAFSSAGSVHSSQSPNSKPSTPISNIPSDTILGVHNAGVDTTSTDHPPQRVHESPSEHAAETSSTLLPTVTERWLLDPLVQNSTTSNQSGDDAMHPFLDESPMGDPYMTEQYAHASNFDSFGNSPIPIFNNFEDSEARLFSPEPSPDLLGCQSDNPSRKRELVLARSRIAEMARSHCKKLSAWAATIELANIRNGLSSRQVEDEGIDVARVSYESLKEYAFSSEIVERPTIITGPFAVPLNHSQEWSTNVRDFTGAQIQGSGDTWLRSLHGTQLCIIVAEPQAAEPESAAFTPTGHSLAIFLDPGDILWMPHHIPYAAITLDPGTMQAGKIWNAASPTSLAEQSLGMLDAAKVLDIVQVILHIPSQLS
ncbi:hypothetical protein LTR59_016842 [Friedmanniomyces endolithicus]|nr:hypothetical protein LTR94_023691 [Friedmanniomyces endolithicus]KAK0769021.1 hypothetical protein LTR38_017995 [Friedmanniomyces endolithicus]KAK0769773.1 hypothetical protein LTR59_016842 [Friedmanniomyces endolithicus]